MMQLGQNDATLYPYTKFTKKHETKPELSEVEKLSKTKDVEQVHWYISGVKIFCIQDKKCY